MERIKSEIKNLIDEWRWHCSAEAKYRCEAYGELLDFINSLQEEPKTSKIMAKKKDKEKLGRDFAPNCKFVVCELNDNMHWVASVSIGDCYYETDPYVNKQDAIDEQRGCLLAIKEQIEKYLATLD